MAVKALGQMVKPAKGKGSLLLRNFSIFSIVNLYQKHFYFVSKRHLKFEKYLETFTTIGDMYNIIISVLLEYQDDSVFYYIYIYILF